MLFTVAGIWPSSCFVLSLACPRNLFAYRTGPPIAESGAPGETTCIRCHGGPANRGAGSITIQFPMPFYQPKQTYHLRVTVSDPSMIRWGFQLTARSALKGSPQAGTFTSVDNFTQSVTNAGLQWIEHTVDGTRLGTPTGATFDFDWSAPSATAGDVVFYAGGVAGDGQDTGATDLVYTTKLTIPLVAGVVAPKPQFTSDGVGDAWAGQTGIAPGAWVTIKGTDLAVGEGDWSPISGQLLATSVGGVELMVNNEAAVISCVSDSGVTFLVPGDIGRDAANIVLIRNGVASDPVTVSVSPALPAIFSAPNPTYPRASYATVATAGAGLAISIVNPAGTMVGASTVDTRVSRPAQLGESIDIYAIGLGGTSPYLPTDRLPPGLATVAGEVTVHFGPVSRTPDAAILVGPGIYLVRTTIPPSLPLNLGTIALRIDVDGISSPSNVFLNVVDPSALSN